MSQLPSSFSKRLDALAKMVNPGSVVADIGSDHGLLVQRLIQLNKVSKVFATENKTGPFHTLSRALFGLPNVFTYLADGLINLPSEVDVVIIAGMGGELISSILNPRVLTLPNVKTIIVSPNNKEKLLRKSLFNNGFIIVAEELIEDHEQFYPIMKWTKGTASYGDLDLEFGPLLRKNKTESFIKMISIRKEKIETLLKTSLPQKRKEELIRQKNRMDNL
jgi:tRNA (adenine22-N1)-methyltransferase